MTYVYYSAIKKHEILPFAASWMSLYSIKLSQINQAEKNTVYYHIYVKSKKEYK